jgi:hypothetical protein
MYQHPREEARKMRDPDRIPAVLKEVEKLWHLHPDWRLGQLICNVAAWADPTQNVIWDMEDDVLVAEVQQHLRQQLEPAEAQPEG